MPDFKSQFNWPPVGQDRVSAFLEKSLLSGNMAQAYIFAGPKDLGKASLALAFARNLWLCDRGSSDSNGSFEHINSDLYILEKEADKKQIGVEQARDFIKRLSLSSFLNSYKIGIVKEAECLSAEAQNALLKTLEEPREQVIVILLTEQIESLLPTIVSRSQVLYFYPVAGAAVYDYLLAELDIKRSLAKELAAASLGRPLQARKWAEKPEDYDEYTKLLEKMFVFLHSDLGERLSLIDSAGNNGGLSAETALAWIDILESLWRDALLLSLGREECLRYPALSDNWREKIALSPAAILDRLRRVLQARAYVQGFVNPRSVLESLAIYF